MIVCYNVVLFNCILTICISWKTSQVYCPLLESCCASLSFAARTAENTSHFKHMHWFSTSSVNEFKTLATDSFKRVAWGWYWNFYEVWPVKSQQSKVSPVLSLLTLALLEWGEFNQMILCKWDLSLDPLSQRNMDIDMDSSRLLPSSVVIIKFTFIPFTNSCSHGVDALHYLPLRHVHFVEYYWKYMTNQVFLLNDVTLARRFKA